MARTAAKLKPLTKAEQKTYESLQKRKQSNEVGSAAMEHVADVHRAIEQEAYVSSAYLGVSPNNPIPAPDSVAATLDERGERYGDFTDHADIAQKLQDVIRDHKYGVGWARMSAVQRQAVTVLCDKLARILNGDPDYADNWHDIQGYAKLVEDRLPK